MPVSLVIKADDLLRGMTPGESIAVNGVCLTITSLKPDAFTTDLMPETLGRSNLGLLSAGDSVNLERPLSLGGRLGGHLVEGHIDAPGSVAVDGVSLTVVTTESSSFQVSVVDYTRQHTTLSQRRVGNIVNLEVDIIAKYVEQLSQARSPGVTMDFLREHGFSLS